LLRSSFSHHHRCRCSSSPPSRSRLLSSFNNEDIISFPFCILEVKTTGGGEEEEWIRTLMESEMVQEAKKFSKFIHGK